MPTLHVKPEGHIDSGSVDYSIAGDTLTVDGSAAFHYLWLHKTVPIHAVYTGAPGVFSRATYAKPGAVVSFPEQGVVITVLDVDAAAARSHCHVADSKYGLAGVATLDVSGDQAAPVSLLSFEAQLSYNGISQHVEVEPA